MPGVLAAGDEAIGVDGVGVSRDRILEDRVGRRVPKRGEAPFHESVLYVFVPQTRATHFVPTISDSLHARSATEHWADKLESCGMCRSPNPYAMSADRIYCTAVCTTLYCSTKTYLSAKIIAIGLVALLQLVKLCHTSTARHTNNIFSPWYRQ